MIASLLAHLYEFFFRFLHLFTGDNLDRLKKPYWLVPEKGVVLITGGTSGLGKESARELARLGYHVIITARDQKKGEKVLEELKNQSGNHNIELLAPLDFASLRSIKEAAQKLIDRKLPIHVLMNNAGSLTEKLAYTVDGLESSWQCNSLGPSYFTRLLLDNVKMASPPARIITLSSIAHFAATLDLDDVELKKQGWSLASAYANSKLANVLFAKELQRRLQNEGRGDILSVSLHPGVVATDFGGGTFLVRLVGLLAFAKSPASGARTQIYTVLAPPKELVAGGYYQDARLAYTSDLANDVVFAEKLWTLNEELVAKKMA